MSVKVMTRVWESSTTSGGPMLVLLAIADSANDEGWAWPSQKTLAEKTRMSERQVRRIVKDIERLGELEIHTKREGRTTRLRYRVLCGQDVRLAVGSPGHSTSVHPDIAVAAEPSTEPSVGRKTSSSSPAAKERDPVWDALTATLFMPHTAHEKKRIGQAARELRAAVAEEFGDMNGGLDLKCAEEVVRRMAAYPREWSARTPEALVKHWTDLGAGGDGADRARVADRLRRMAEHDAGKGAE